MEKITQKKEIMKLLEDCTKEQALDFLCDGEALGKLGITDKELVEEVFDEIKSR